MKKNRIYVIALAALMILGGCAKEEFEAPVSVKKETGAIDFTAQSFNASIATADETRTYIGEDNKIYWTKDDRVSVFCSSTDNLQYTFTGETGSRTGILHKIVSGASAGTELDRNYAFYPYDASNSISGEGVMTVNVPATQTYSEDTFGAGANLMAAVTTGTGDYDLQFKNAGGYLVIQLYGEATVRKLVLTSTAGEKLSGKADIAFDNTGAPVLTMHSDASSSITLDCGDGVKLGKSVDKATEFWFVLPPVTFSQGFSLQVVCDEGSFAKQKSTAGTIHRNGIVTVSPFSVSTRAGKFIGLSCAPEIFDAQKIVTLLGDQIQDFGLSEGVLELLINILNKNGDIKISRVIYTTNDPKGNVVEASGLVAFPTSLPETGLIDRSTTYDKITSVQHYTCNIDEAPSVLDLPVEMLVSMKAGNDVVVLSDYVGYGVSRTGDLQHPYIHNKLTGAACADLIEAAQDYVAQEGLTRAKDWEIELMGYSQGGAATISTLLELEARGYENIGKVYAGGGPHDLIGFMDKFIKNPETPFRRTGFIAYLIRGLVYGDRLDVDFHNVFNEYVFTSGAFDKFSTLGVDDWSGILGTDIRNLLHADFFAADNDYNGNEDVKKVIESVNRNSVINYNLKNASHVTLYHSPSDDTVLYDCSKNASAKWGCPLVNLDSKAHDDAGIEFFCRYFDTIWVGIIPINVWDVVKGFLL